MVGHETVISRFSRQIISKIVINSFAVNIPTRTVNTIRSLGIIAEI